MGGGMIIKCNVLPPGINATYRVSCKGGKARFYKSQEAKDWQEKFALIVGSEAAIQDWEDKGQDFVLYLYFDSGHDTDATIKIVQDTISEKLGFNDERIKEIHLFNQKLEDCKLEVELNDKIG